MSEKREAGVVEGRPEAKNTSAQATVYMVSRNGYG